MTETSTKAAAMSKSRSPESRKGTALGRTREVVTVRSSPMLMPATDSTRVCAQPDRMR